MTNHHLSLVAALAVSLLAGCAGHVGSQKDSVTTSVHHEKPRGFLAAQARPDTLGLIPPPPAENTAWFEADKQTYLSTRKYRFTPRWEQARLDANLSFPEAVDAFSCALGVSITPAQTPQTYQLMANTMEDADRSVDAPKKTYQRQRPFVYFDQQTCTPESEAFLRKNGSYPSGHTTIGWTWSLVLGQVAPERADALNLRGYQFGQSRIICGAHWASDVAAGRVAASTVFSKLQSNPAYLKQVQAAQAEIRHAKEASIQPPKDCSLEAQRLSTPGPDVP
jgi:acid phosphatase (class A)